MEFRVRVGGWRLGSEVRVRVGGWRLGLEVRVMNPFC